MVATMRFVRQKSLSKTCGAISHSKNSSKNKYQKRNVPQKVSLYFQKAPHSTMNQLKMIAWTKIQAPCRVCNKETSTVYCDMKTGKCICEECAKKTGGIKSPVLIRSAGVIPL